MTDTTLHGSEVRGGQTYCTDCGCALSVGSLESMKHTDPITHARGRCPNALQLVPASTKVGAHRMWFVVAGLTGVDAGQAIFGPTFRAQAEAFRDGVIYGRSH